MFEDRWHYPNCIGATDAMDGKYILLKQPWHNGFYYFNYKRTFSTVLLALVDVDYKFLYADVGFNGRISDGGVYCNTSLWDAIQNNILNIPKLRLLDGAETVLHCHCRRQCFPVKRKSNEALSFPSFILREKNIYYRLSRARRIVENPFGILTNRFYFFRFFS